MIINSDPHVPSEKNNQDKEFIDLILEKSELSLDENDVPWITFIQDDKPTTKILSRSPDSDVADWITSLYLEEHNKLLLPQKVKAMLQHLIATAKQQGRIEKIHCRSYEQITEEEDGGLSRALFFDLNDHDGKIVKVTAEGVFLLLKTETGLKFRSTSGMSPMPSPSNNPDLEKLCKYVNLEDPELLPLLMIHIAAMMSANSHIPICNLIGSAGSGKTELSRMIKSIVDPSAQLGSAISNNERDTMIYAQNSRLMSFDNEEDAVSKMKSNMLARLVTGGGFRIRAHYTDMDEIQINVSRPILVNSIVSVAVHPDLGQRTLAYPLARIQPDQRQSLDTLQRDFNKDLPDILAGFFELISLIYATLPTLSEQQELPRMADFAKLGLAVEKIWEMPTGWFLKLYKKSQMQSVDGILSSNPDVELIHELLKSSGETWKGNTTQLIRSLNTVGARLPGEYRINQSPIAMGRKLMSYIPVLEKMGIHIDRKRGGTRLITLSRTKDFVDDSSPTGGVTIVRSQAGSIVERLSIPSDVS